MNEIELLKSMKKRTRSSNTVKYGMFGLTLGAENYA